MDQLYQNKTTQQTHASTNDAMSVTQAAIRACVALDVQGRKGEHEGFIFNLPLHFSVNMCHYNPDEDSSLAHQRAAWSEADLADNGASEKKSSSPCQP